MYQILTLLSYASQVLPLYTANLPSSGNHNFTNKSVNCFLSKSENNGTAKFSHKVLAINHKCVSNTCPRFILETTPSGFKITSIGCPSSVNGISSSGIILATIPLLPCLQDILSQISTFLVLAIYTFIFFKTFEGKSSHFSESRVIISTTLPEVQAGKYKEVSFTDFDLSPNIA